MLPLHKDIYEARCQLDKIRMRRCLFVRKIYPALAKYILVLKESSTRIYIVGAGQSGDAFLSADKIRNRDLAFYDMISSNKPAMICQMLEEN